MLYLKKNRSLIEIFPLLLLEEQCNTKDALISVDLDELLAKINISLKSTSDRQLQDFGTLQKYHSDN